MLSQGLCLPSHYKERFGEGGRNNLFFPDQHETQCIPSLPPAPGDGHMGQSEARILYYALIGIPESDSELLIMFVEVWALTLH